MKNTFHFVFIVICLLLDTKSYSSLNESIQHDQSNQLQKLCKKKQIIVEQLKKKYNIASLNKQACKQEDKIRKKLKPLTEQLKVLDQNKEKNHNEMEIIKQKIIQIKEEELKNENICLKQIGQKIRKIQNYVRKKIKEKTAVINAEIEKLQNNTAKNISK